MARLSLSPARPPSSAWNARGGHGAAYIYGVSNDSLSLQDTLIDPDEQPFDFFGKAVAVSGSVALIGADDYDAVYVYVRSGGRWHYQTTITGHYGGFGSSIAISGSTAVIGAPYTQSNDSAAYVYVRSGDGARWRQQAVLVGPHGSGGYFGEAVAVSGDTVVVGASTADRFAGAAYVYARSKDRWRLQAALPDPAGRPNDNFGTSVAASGGTVLIGAPGTRDYDGTAYVYGRSGSKWRKRAALTVARRDDMPGGFGSAVALSGTGSDSIALISGVSESGLTTASRLCGHAYEFTRPAGHWRMRKAFSDPECNPYDEFGYALALSGTKAVIGSPGTNHDKGRASVVTLRLQ
jgi:FG-GAP repeat protein